MSVLGDSGQPRALSGLRVLDFSAVMAGPYCGRWLADLGAEVIKVEPVEGEMMRMGEPMRAGHSAYFAALNAGKRAVALDLKNQDVIAALHTMVASTDVVLENFRAGVMDRLGLGFATLSALNPRLVYCSVSGYGQKGPAAGRPAFAQIVHAASGYDLVQASYQDDADKPATCGVYPADVLAATFATIGIQTALLQRERTGVGQHVDVSLIESIMSVMVYETQRAQFEGGGVRPLSRPMRTRDGFVLVVTNTDRNFHALCDVIGLPGMKTDPDFARIPQRAAHWTDYCDRIEAWTLQRSSEDCERELMAAGVPCSRYRTIDEAISDSHFAYRESFATVKDAAGSCQVLSVPFKLSGSATSTHEHVSAIGADTREVLARLGGLDSARIDALIECGAARAAASDGDELQ